MIPANTIPITSPPTNAPLNSRLPLPNLIFSNLPWAGFSARFYFGKSVGNASFDNLLSHAASGCSPTFHGRLAPDELTMRERGEAHQFRRGRLKLTISAFEIDRPGDLPPIIGAFELGSVAGHGPGTAVVASEFFRSIREPVTKKSLRGSQSGRGWIRPDSGCSGSGK